MNDIEITDKGLEVMRMRARRFDISRLNIVWSDQWVVEADFICNARDNVIDLIEEVKRLRGILEASGGI